MARLKDNVEAILNEHFTGATIRLHGLPGGRLGGSVVWDGFEARPQIERQSELRNVIDSGLPAEQQLKVSFILTITPTEEAAMEPSQRTKRARKLSA